MWLFTGLFVNTVIIDNTVLHLFGGRIMINGPQRQILRERERIHNPLQSEGSCYKLTTTQTSKLGYTMQ